MFFETKDSFVLVVGRFELKKKKKKKKNRVRLVGRFQ